MPKESGLTQTEISTLEIKRFIFHVIKTSEQEPIYLEEVLLEDLDEEQITFFKERLTAAASGTQFLFSDKAKSEVYKYCKSIIDDSNANFVASSESLTSSFRSHHRSQSIDGVFIIVLVTVAQKRDLVFLLKIDNTKVYGYKTEGAKVILQKIKDSFVEDIRAIQKVAIIDISEYYIWDILAQDKKAGTGKVIGDYFRTFLNAVERETDSVLTNKAITLVRQWAASNEGLTETNSEPSTYKQRTINFLLSNEKFDTRNLIREVIKDEDPIKHKSASDSLLSFLEEKGLAGQVFTPQKGAINKQVRRNKRRTAEGVLIEWEGDPIDSGIEIKPKDENNMYTIIIRTTVITDLS